MRFRIFSVILILLAFLLLEGCNTTSRIKKADNRFEIGEYYAAGDLYKRCYSQLSSKDKPMRAYVAFQQGECYRLTNYYRAEQAFANSIRNNFSDSIVFLRYAQQLHKNRKYADALKYYKIYLQKDSSNIVAKNGILAIDSIEQWKKYSYSLSNKL